MKDRQPLGRKAILGVALGVVLTLLGILGAFTDAFTNIVLETDRIGTGLESGAFFERAVLRRQRDLVIAFSIAYAPHGKYPHEPLWGQSRGWTKAALDDLHWLDLDAISGKPISAGEAPRLDFGEETVSFAVEPGDAEVPILRMPILRSADEDKRFIREAVSRYGLCLLQFSLGEKIIARSTTAPGHVEVALVSAPRREYTRWWAGEVRALAYPIALPLRALFFVGYVLVAIVGGGH